MSYVILSWPHLNDKGYYLSWENRSFGSEVSENMIKSIDVYPAPLDLISQIRIEPKDYRSTFENKVQVGKLRKFGTHQYNLDADVESSYGVVVLSQGFEKGWVAFDLSGSTPRVLQKIKYNGWANAWIIPESGEHEIVILFWPQLLSFAGYGLLIITFAGFGLVFMMNKKNKSQKRSQIEHRIKTGLSGK